MSGPDPSKPIPSATGVLRAQSDDAGFEADFADLAARFAAQSGGGLSAELSADLALEIVLNEIVDQACLATGATGAAIVLQRGGEMVCRASSGSTAPQLGARLDTASGLSGECIRTRRTQRCDDVLSDQRVDLEASQRLGVRSVMVMPLLRGDELAGVFELFSSLPSALGERDERTLEALAGRILSNLTLTDQVMTNKVLSNPVLTSEERAAQPLAPQNEPLPVSEPLLSEPLQETIPEIAENSPRREFDFVTAFLRAAVFACAVLLGLLLGRHLGSQKATARARPAAPTSNANSVASVPAVSPPSAEKKDLMPAVRSSSVRTGSDPVPAGSLLVYENGKEVFRQSPARSEAVRGSAEGNQGESSSEQGTGMQRASSVELEKVVELSPAAAEGSLLHRVEPEYPEAARLEQIQGPVVVDVHIGVNGAVQDVQVVSGSPQLAQASTDAVRQWRFKPRNVNGRAAEMQTRITLNFRLPQ